MQDEENTPIGSLEKWCRKKCPNLVNFREIDAYFGEYQPRVSRGPWLPNNFIADATDRTRSFVSSDVLMNNLEKVFRCIEPDPANADAFGHEIRNLLLLACMEVESSFTAILKANQYDPNTRWTISDYQKLSLPLSLEIFQVRLAQYPRWGTFLPFAGWDSSKPGSSLSWWKNYNKTKHDREKHFELATLRDAVAAVGAVVVMLIVQFGSLSGDDQGLNLLSKYFYVERTRRVQHEDFYVPSPDNKWKPNNLKL